MTTPSSMLTSPRRIADFWLLFTGMAFMAWALASIAWGHVHLAAALSYLVPPILLGVGVVVGRWQAVSTRAWIAPVAAAALGMIVLLAVPFYANAQAALGVQLVALAGLVLLQGWVGDRSDASKGVLAVLAVGVGVLGVLLAARSQAATVLVLAVALVAAVAVLREAAPPRRTVAWMGLLATGLGALAVIALGSLARWPEALNEGQSLSGVRHELWSDALILWRENPVLGGEPGSFVEHSQIAASRPDLAWVHSSILQIGAELGAVGAVLFLGILVAGTAVAARGDRPQALLAVTAWSALAIHSMIDHLYHVSVVTVVAGVVIGWAGRKT